jgi:hypothetical protein
MKNTSFKRLWTKTSVKRILKEYLASPSQFPFICLRSKEFEGLWRDYRHRQKISDLAFQFSAIPIGNLGCAKTSVLFNKDGLSREEYQKLRIDFLKHEIKRLSNK